MVYINARGPQFPLQAMFWPAKSLIEEPARVWRQYVFVGQEGFDQRLIEIGTTKTCYTSLDNVFNINTNFSNLVAWKKRKCVWYIWILCCMNPDIVCFVCSKFFKEFVVGAGIIQSKSGWQNTKKSNCNPFTFARFLANLHAYTLANHRIYLLRSARRNKSHHMLEFRIFVPNPGEVPELGPENH